MVANFNWQLALQNTCQVPFTTLVVTWQPNKNTHTTPQQTSLIHKVTHGRHKITSHSLPGPQHDGYIPEIDNRKYEELP